MALKPNKSRVGSKAPSMNTYPVSSGYASAIYRGDPVKLSAGYIVLAGNGDKTLGVAVGFNYINSEGQPVAGKYLPAATSITDAPYDSFQGNSVPTVKIVDDPMCTFLIDADSSVSIGHIGQNFRVSGIGSGSTLTGDSSNVLKVASATTSGGDAASADAQTMVRLVGIIEQPDNDIGDSAPTLEVVFNYHEFFQTNV